MGLSEENIILKFVWVQQADVPIKPVPREKINVRFNDTCLEPQEIEAAIQELCKKRAKALVIFPGGYAISGREARLKAESLPPVDEQLTALVI